MYNGNQHEELSRQSLVRQAATINSTGRTYFREDADAQRFAGERQNFLVEHEEVGKVTLMQRVEYLTFAVGLVCIYGIDIMLFGASAQYIAALLDGGTNLWASVAKFTVPAFFLGIEV